MSAIRPGGDSEACHSFVYPSINSRIRFGESMRLLNNTDCAEVSSNLIKIVLVTETEIERTRKASKLEVNEPLIA